MLKTAFPVKAYDVPGRPGLKSTYQYHPGMPSNFILRASKSSVGQAGFCTQQYFIKYVLGIKESMNDDMLRGINVHNVVEQWYKDLNVSYAASMRGYGMDRVLEYFFSIIPEPEESYGLGEEHHIARFINAEAKRFMNSEPEFFLPIINEKSFDAVVEFDGTLVHLTGIIDRAFLSESGHLHIHELKTGKCMDKYGKPKKKKIEAMAEEMAYYLFLLNKSEDPSLGGVEAGYWGWDFTGHDEGIQRFREPVRIPPIQAMKDSIRDLIRMHSNYTGGTNGSPFPLLPEKSTEYICEPWCRVKGYCPRYHRVLMSYDTREDSPEE